MGFVGGSWWTVLPRKDELYFVRTLQPMIFFSFLQRCLGFYHGMLVDRWILQRLSSQPYEYYDKKNRFWYCIYVKFQALP